MSTTFSGPVISQNGFQGNFTGNITGNVTGNLTGNVTGNVTGNTTGLLTGRVQESVQNLSGAGAANLTTGVTLCTSTGAAQVVTLANGTAGQIGLLKTIIHSVDGGSIVVTPATASGFTTVTLAAVADVVTLMYTAVGWVIVSKNIA